MFCLRVNMESVSHLSTIPSQLYEEHFDNQLNLVGKCITYINTLINADDVYNVPNFTLTDAKGNKISFPQGNYNVEDFLTQLIQSTQSLPVLDEYQNPTGAYGPIYWDESDPSVRKLMFKTDIPTSENQVFYRFLPPVLWDRYIVNSYVVVDEDYMRNYITWYKIYMLRVYANIVDMDNDLITIPLYAKRGLDNTFSVSNLSIPCIDGIYNDIKWIVYDQLNNPIVFPSSKLYVYFTAS